VRVARGQRQHLRGHVLRELLLELRRVGVQHLGHAGDARGALRGLRGVVAGHQHVHLASELRGGRHGGVGRALEQGVFVFGNDEDAHDQITFASFFSLATSAATSGTITPAPRLAGSTTFSVLMRGATSTPSASGFTVSSGFFFAFMMLGSVT